MKIGYMNGIIHTMNNHEIVAAMIVEDEKIIAVGSNEIIKEHSLDKIIDLNNKTVIPGFNDSHMHALLSAEKMQQIDVSSARSIDELIELAKQQLPEKLDSDTWIIGRGWNQDYFDVKEFPNKNDLDKITTECPIVMIRACIHICAVNSKALEIINLDKDNLPILDDGMIYTDNDGELNGLFSESALNYVYSNFPKTNLEDIKSLINNIQKRLNSEGITSIQTDDFTALNNVDYTQIIKAYTDMATDNQLTVKVYQQCLLAKPSLFKDFLAKGYKSKQDFGLYRLGPLKLLLDGSLGARTAVIEGNYHDDPDANGISVYTDDELNEFGVIAQNNDMQMAIHGIGDGAVNQIMKMYEKIESEIPKKDTRHGIVHCQITESNVLDRIAKQKVVIYAQPIFLHYDIHIVEDRVGTRKASTSYAFKTLMDKGVSVSMGTDSPVEPTNPFNNIYCAVTRKDLNNSLTKGWFENECLSVYEAVHAYTYEGAFQSFEEDRKGTLEVNKYADFIVLDQDIFTIDIEDIVKTKVLKTFVNGKLVYSV